MVKITGADLKSMRKGRWMTEKTSPKRKKQSDKADSQFAGGNRRFVGKMDSLRKQISDRLERRDPLGMSWMGMAVWQRRIMQMVIRWKVFAS